MKHNLKRFFAAATKDNTLELTMYDQIGADFFGEGVTAKDVKAKIDAAGDISRIAVRINSPGGDVFEGAAIYSLLTQSGKPVDIFIDGLAASAAFTIAMAGNTISIGESATMMLHNAWSLVMGDANDMRDRAITLDKISGTMRDIYAKRSGMKANNVQALMDAETWLSAQDAVDNGFADQVIAVEKDQAAQAKALAATFELSARFKKTPEQFKADAADPNDPNTDPVCDCQCGPCRSGNHADCTEDPCPSEFCSCDNPKEDGSMDASAQAAAAAQLAASFDRMKKRIQIAEL